MKRTWIPAIAILVLALIAATGSQSFLSPCIHEDGSFGACHWAGQALLGVSGLLGAMALLTLVFKAHRAGLYLATLPTAILGMLIPNGLIALCRVDSMRCRALMRPAMTILFAFVLIAALVGALMTLRRDSRA